MFADVGLFRKLLHLIPVLPVYFIIFTVIYGFTKFYTFANETAGFFRSLVIISFYICALMTIVCHTLAMFTNNSLTGCTALNGIETFSQVDKSNKDLFCRKCDKVRPYRTHHCKVCNKCILKMDHHCPWVANCVGVYSQKYFFLFLFYATIGDFIAFLALVGNLTTLDLAVRVDKELSLLELIVLMHDKLMLIFSVFFSIAMTLAIGFLLAGQYINIINNTTTIEWKLYPERKDNPWVDQYTGVVNNLKAVLGENPLTWLLPTVVFNENYNKRSTEMVCNYITLDNDDNLHINLNLND
jgi:hypothetical protein